MGCRNDCGIMACPRSACDRSPFAMPQASFLRTARVHVSSRTGVASPASA